MTLNSVVKVLLVDDHMVVRAGLAQVIGVHPGFEIAGEAENGEDALHLCDALRPDIVIMDVRMRGMGGVAATEAMRRRYPAVKVIGLSTFDDKAAVDQVLAAGAHGFMSKTVTAAELINTLLRVQRGESVVLTEHWDDAPSEGPVHTAADVDTLGTQQRRVLALLTKGCTNAEIGKYLGISVPTARYHVSAILQKLGVTNRAEAAAMAIRDSLINQDDF